MRTQKKLDQSYQFYSRIYRDANNHVPTDGWLAKNRAKTANDLWQKMMGCIHEMLGCLAREMKNWPDN